MFNKLLKEAGEFGLYQKFLTFGFLLLTMIVISFVNWTQIFILMRPPHRCKTHPNDTVWLTNDTILQVEQCFLTLSDGYLERNVLENGTGASFQVFNSSFIKNNTTENVPCPYGWVYDFSSMFPTFATEQNLVCGDSWKMYTIHTAFYAGSFIGAIIAGWLTDKYGRKLAYQLCLLLNILADVATFFAPNVKTFAAARFFSSMGCCSLPSIAVVLAMEYTGPRHRLLNLATFSIPYVICSAIVPWVVYTVSSWRYIMVITYVPSITALLLSKFAPESVSWLMASGRLDETAKSLHHVAKVNGKHLSLSYIKGKLEEQKSVELQRSAEVNAETKSSLLRKSGLFGTPRMRRRIIILILLRMVVGSCYHGMALEGVNLPFRWYLSYSLGAISELPATILCFLAADKIGRRWSTISFLSLGGVLGITAGKFVKDESTILAMSMVSRACFYAGIDMALALATESIPTLVRGMGTLLIRSIGGIAIALTPFIVYLSETDKLLPLVVLGGLATFGAVLASLLPETAQQHTPHSIEDGENFGEGQAFCFCPFLVQRSSSNMHKEDNGAANSGYEEELS